MKTTLIIFSILFAECSLNSCKKSCYDANLAAQYALVDCAMNGPSVVGCDGKTYQNACIAGSQGIRVK